MIYEIKLDIDGEIDRLDIAKRFLLLRKFLRINNYNVKEVKTFHGYHIYIEIDTDVKLDGKDIVIIQLFLGSDYKREMFNWIRVRSNLNNWNVLFKKKFRVENGKFVLKSREIE